MNETVAGAPGDLLDYVTYLRCMARLPAETYLVIEHTPVDQIAVARDYVLPGLQRAVRAQRLAQIA
mgnify:CR=1 FL=1